MNGNTISVYIDLNSFGANDYGMIWSAFNDAMDTFGDLRRGLPVYELTDTPGGAAVQVYNVDQPSGPNPDAGGDTASNGMRGGSRMAWRRESVFIALDGQPIALSDAWSGVLFDITGCWGEQWTAWPACPDAGLLAMDLDGDGKISSGRELFGTHTRLTDGTMAVHCTCGTAEWCRPAQCC